MKIRLGIVGYGNLGKAVEQEILRNNNFKLVAIFSRRSIKSVSSTPVEPFENYILYKNKIDIMLLCGGSKSDIEEQAPIIAEYFDTINTFDTHAKIKTLHKTLDEITKKSNTRAIMCCGWDPGVFSVIRGLFLAISQKLPYTFWGKGVSMGHSDALRNVDGVIDAVQFTIPNPEAVSLAKKDFDISNIPHHFRDCYVYTDKNQEKIESEIKNIPNYFKGQPTKVIFISGLGVLKLKNKQSHKGMVITSFKSQNHLSKMTFSVSMQSNPAFTARIMATYISAIINLKQENKCGAFTPLDIPISYLFLGSNKENLLTNIC